MTDPRCTIVIPVHDRAGLTRRCLATILADPPETPFEIVVVDDASTDGTPDVLADQPVIVRSVRREDNRGFAVACNVGAAAARGELIVFLNNDTEPHPGWLDALVDHADAHPDAAAVGSLLLFPDGTVQHAGVVICQDGRPRHLYAGFPADYYAVQKPRAFQAVTAASMLVRRTAFERAGGFDTGFRNSLEDVDLCLRLRDAGSEIHYCPSSVVMHLESASRGRGSANVQHNYDLFQERWGDKVEPDDLHYYMEDDLLRLHYRDLYPLGIDIAPELATARTAGDEGALIEAQQRHIGDLLREVVRLTAYAAELDNRASGAAIGVSAGTADRLEVKILELQELLASGENGFEPSETLSYRMLLSDIRDMVDESVPPDATVAVISHGDEHALELGERRGWHFPQEPDGTYAGHYPEDSAEAVAHLEELRAKGAQYLLVPSTSAWWLDYYDGFAQHLRDHYPPPAEREEFTLYALVQSTR